MTVAAIRRRIKSITLAVVPASDSFKGRLNRLSESDQAAYQFYVNRQKRWISNNPDKNYYEAVLDADAPLLPDWLIEKLSGHCPVVSETFTIGQIQSIYQKMALGMQI